MGRSVLAIWALGLAPADVGYLAVAFAPAEPTVNLARTAQPAVIEMSARSRRQLATLIKAIGVLGVVGTTLGFVLIVPLFGEEYAPARGFLVAIGISQIGYAICVALVGRRYARTPRQAITIQSVLGALILIVGLISSQCSSTATVWTYAALSILAAGSLIWSDARTSARVESTH